MKRIQIFSTNQLNRFVNVEKKISGWSEGSNRQKVIVVDKLEQLANWRRENGKIYCTISIPNSVFDITCNGGQCFSLENIIVYLYP